ncbi:MAG TPA: RluA family pseudouridine synthase [Bacteroidota bacterium]|nr:RluA family pseudouridine synthase [Bacteroidota bacterium]
MTLSSEIIVPPGKIRERIDVYLMHYIENATRTKIQSAIKGGYVFVNGKKVKSSYKVSPNDVIHLTIPKPPPTQIVPEHIPLDIIHEDEHLLVVNKPPGMVTHPAYSNYHGTLVNALLYHCNQSLSSVNDPTRPGIVHRLDKDTSGLLVVAKDDKTHAQLAKQFSSRTIEREYCAIVWGLFLQTGKENNGRTGVIEAALGRSKSDRKKFAVSAEGKHAVTKYEVLQEFDYLSLLKLNLQTGRTHQIRVHLHHIGHPVFGDPTYGGRRIAWGPTDKQTKEEVQNLLRVMSRQALHAKTIGFIHPVTMKKLRFNSELPEDMNEVLKLLRERSH